MAAKEKESKGEKVGEVGMGTEVKVQEGLWAGVMPDTQGAPAVPGQMQSWPQTTHAGLSVGRPCQGGSWAVASLEGSGFVCQWEACGITGTWVIFSALTTWEQNQEDSTGLQTTLLHLLHWLQIAP